MEFAVLLPVDPTTELVWMYLHSSAIGDCATRGGLTLRDGTMAMPAASGSLIVSSSVALVSFISVRRSKVARLNTNSPAVSALCWLCLRPLLENITNGFLWPATRLKKL